MYILYACADEGILETSRLAGPDSIVQFRVEIARCNLDFLIFLQ